MTVTLEAGEQMSSFSVNITDDDIAEAEESYAAVILAPNAEGRCAILVTVTNDDGKNTLDCVHSEWLVRMK